VSVSAQAIGYFKACADRGWIDLEELLEGSGYTAADAANTRKLIPWDEWAALCDRFTEMVGEERMAESAEVILDGIDMTRPIFQIAPLMLSARELYRFSVNYVASMIYRDLRFSVESLDGRRLRITAEIPPPHRACRAWLVMFRSTMERLPRFQGGPPTRW
jgi:hypothetical protein